MSPKAGRPRISNPKDTMVRVRMDKETIQKLDKCAAVLKVTRSDVIRLGIDKVESELK